MILYQQIIERFVSKNVNEYQMHRFVLLPKFLIQENISHQTLIRKSLKKYTQFIIS